MTKQHKHGLFYNTVYFFNFIVETVTSILTFTRYRYTGKLVLLRQVLFTGIEALWLISFSAFIIGGIIIIQANSLFVNIGQGKLLFSILVSVITRELGSFIPAIILIARSGTAITTELGNMVVNDEVESLVALGISPFSYLVAPRVLAVIISLVPLSIYFNLIAFLGGGLVYELFYDLTFSDFLGRLSAELQMKDIYADIIKTIVFGFFIAVISCYHGLRVERAGTEVPQRTSKAVVFSISTVILFDVIITSLLYFI